MSLRKEEKELAEWIDNHKEVLRHAIRDVDDEARIKEFMKTKMTHIKMYNECMNLADGLDVEKFAELVRADEREWCAYLCSATAPGRDAEAIEEAIRARGEK
jgi:hypothetical protein